jgi:hypothetical protein
MANDPSRKTLRHFYCRDLLWKSFEQMSEELDRGVDELVNDAMRAFARQQGYLPSDLAKSTGSDLSRPEAGGLPKPDARAGSGPQADSQAESGLARTGLRRAVPPPVPAMHKTSEQPTSRPQGAPGNFSVPSQGDVVAAPPLFVIFGNQRYIIDKEQFIIGRGSKSSDLPIRDGNISRKHAVVIRRNGEYFIKDLGSTNGIDYKGDRIEGKKIEEGDVFSICEYQLKFTFK